MKTIRSQQGQGMTEYIIVVALIAVAAIGIYTPFGKTVHGQIAATVQALAGDSLMQCDQRLKGKWQQSQCTMWRAVSN